MKKDIHPTYNPVITASCVCGNAFTVGSTLKAINVEVCSNCHPFYTGEERIVDTAGRVEKFKARRETAKEKQATMKPKKPRAKKNAKKGEEEAASVAEGAETTTA